MARADLNVSLGLITKQFEKSLKQSQRLLRNFARDTEQIGRSLTTAITLPVAGIGAAAIRSAAQFEQLRTELSVLTGSAEAGAAAFERLVQFSAKTPLRLDDIARANNTLIGFGLSSDEAFTALQRLGDLSGGNSERLQRIAVAFGQVAASGRLTAQDINQFVNNGVPLLKLFEDAGIASASAVKQLASEGKIGLPELQAAIAAATSEGGQFFGLLEAQSRTLGGVLSTLSDNLNLAAAELGETIVETFNLDEAAVKLTTTIQGLVATFKGLPEEQQKAIVKTLAYAAAIGPALLTVAGLAKALSLLRKQYLIIKTLKTFSIDQFKKWKTTVAAASEAAGGFRNLLKGVGKRMLIVSGQVLLVTAAIAGIGGVFLFIKKNAEAFSVAFQRIFINLATRTGNVIKGIVRSFANLLSIVDPAAAAALKGLTFAGEVELPDPIKFQSFDEFITELKGDANEILGQFSTLTDAYKGLKKLFSDPIPVQESASPVDIAGPTGTPTGGGPATPGIPLNEARGVFGESLTSSIGLMDTFEARIEAARTASAGLNANLAEGLLPTIEKLPLEPVREFASNWEQVANTVANYVGPALDALFENILTNGENAFKAFVNVLRDALKQLIKLVAQAAILAGILSIFGIGPGFKALFNKFSGGIFSGGPQFAEGGIVTGPTRALVGEAGPEAIIPLSQLNRLGIGGGNLELKASIRGSDLLLAIERANIQTNRIRG